MRNLSIIAAASCIISMPASADELWVCNFPGAGTDQPNPVRYVLHDKYLTEYGLGWTYHILIDDDIAIVATSGEGGKSSGIAGVSHPLIQTNTVAINRKTGDAVKGAIVLYGPIETPIHGTCVQKELPLVPK
jgi:hypothetical protein